MGWYVGWAARVGFAASAAVLSSQISALAAPQTIQDQYFGGINGYCNCDVIGPTTVFDITTAVLTVTGNTLTVQINTNFAGVYTYLRANPL